MLRYTNMAKIGKNKKKRAPKTSNLLNRLLAYKDTVFKVNYASGTVIVGCIAAVIYFYNDNKSLRGTVESQKVTNNQLVTTVGELTKSVSNLNGSMEIVKNTLNIFVENPPSIINMRLDAIEKRFNAMYGESRVPVMTAIPPSALPPH